MRIYEKNFLAIGIHWMSNHWTGVCVGLYMCLVRALFKICKTIDMLCVELWLESQNILKIVYHKPFALGVINWWENVLRIATIKPVNKSGELFERCGKLCTWLKFRCGLCTKHRRIMNVGTDALGANYNVQCAIAGHYKVALIFAWKQVELWCSPFLSSN